MPEPLREAINDAVMRYLADKLEDHSEIDIAAMAREMSLSIVDMVMQQIEQHQGPLLAEIITTLGDEYLRRRVFVPSGRH